MKLRKDRDVLNVLGIGIGTLAIGAISFVLIKPAIGIGLASVGVILVLIALRLASTPKGYFTDERLLKINEKAGYAAYGFMSAVAGIVLFLNAAKPNAALTPSEDFVGGAMLIWFVGTSSFFILSRWYGRKGV